MHLPTGSKGRQAKHTLLFFRFFTFGPLLEGAAHSLEGSLLLNKFIKEMPSQPYPAACFFVDLSSNMLTTKNNVHSLVMKLGIFNDELFSCCSGLGYFDC